MGTTGVGTIDEGTTNVGTTDVGTIEKGITDVGTTGMSNVSLYRDTSAVVREVRNPTLWLSPMSALH